MFILNELAERFITVGLMLSPRSQCYVTVFGNTVKIRQQIIRL